MPIHYPKDAPTALLHFPKDGDGPKRTRNRYRSASRPCAQVLADQILAYLISIVAIPSNFFLIASAS